MKAVGMTRKVDHLGRIILPKELRDNLGINCGDPVEIYPEGEYLYVKKKLPECIFCESSENVIEYDEKAICKSCIDELKLL